MPKALHAIDYLTAPDKHPPRPVCVVFGNDSFLKQQALLRIREQVLEGGEADFSLSRFEGRAAELSDVLDELATVAMFGGGRRLVVVEEADELVSQYRAELEEYVGRPKSTGVLVLEVRSWPANTRLYRALAQEGLQVDCSSPTAGRLNRWLASWAEQAHGVRIVPSAVELLVEMVGPELGLLDQELAKLALTANPGEKIVAETVGRLVGSWRARTTWEMLDAALSGDVREALSQLDRLLLAGESPVAVLGQISASLRRFAAATRLVLQAEARGRPIGLSVALQQAGVRQFVLAKAEMQLRKLGRHRGDRLYRWLLEADLGLKGASAVPPRLILERLIVRLADPQGRQSAAAR
ncbi:MAG: DNA polymerase III subunit delta [Planctomycetota bacterium]|jgi:DNA polymerase-3 subunit delta